MSAPRRAAPRGAQPNYGAAQRRTTVTPCIGAKAGVCGGLPRAAAGLCRAGRGIGAGGRVVQ